MHYGLKISNPVSDYVYSKSSINLLLICNVNRNFILRGWQTHNCVLTITFNSTHRLHTAISNFSLAVYSLLGHNKRIFMNEQIHR